MHGEYGQICCKDHLIHVYRPPAYKDHILQVPRVYTFHVIELNLPLHIKTTCVYGPQFVGPSLCTSFTLYAVCECLIGY